MQMLSVRTSSSLQPQQVDNAGSRMRTIAYLWNYNALFAKTTTWFGLGFDDI